MDAFATAPIALQSATPSFSEADASAFIRFLNCKNATRRVRPDRADVKYMTVFLRNPAVPPLSQGDAGFKQTTLELYCLGDDGLLCRRTGTADDAAKPVLFDDEVFAAVVAEHDTPEHPPCSVVVDRVNAQYYRVEHKEIKWILRRCQACKDMKAAAAGEEASAAADKTGKPACIVAAACADAAPRHILVGVVWVPMQLPSQQQLGHVPVALIKDLATLRLKATKLDAEDAIHLAAAVADWAEQHHVPDSVLGYYYDYVAGSSSSTSCMPPLISHFGSDDNADIDVNMGPNSVHDGKCAAALLAEARAARANATLQLLREWYQISCELGTPPWRW
jgi:hypothetical protein